jgi:hypothetical protein
MQQPYQVSVNPSRDRADTSDASRDIESDRDQPANIVTRYPSRDECIDLCYHLLERPLANRGSDQNRYDFLSCVNRCMGKE